MIVDRTFVVVEGTVKMAKDCIRLRRPTEDDVEKFLAWSHDEELGDLTGWEYPDEEEKIRDWLFNKTHNRDRRFLVIEYNAHPIGDIELCNIAWRSGHAELKVCIAEKQYWNKGLGTRAINMVLEEAFEHLGLEEVYLRVYGKNQRAVRAYGKVGFTIKGFLRRKDPDWQEIWLMSLTKARFREMKRQASA